MIGRKTLFVDRLATFVLAVAFLAAGGALIWWWTGESPFVDRVDASPVADVVAQGWWPWASAAVGLLLILVGLRWIAAHLSSQRISSLALRGSNSNGKLSINVSKAASAAADAFADTIGVRSAKGYVHRDRGQMVARIRAVIEPEADLAAVAARADQVSEELGHVVGRKELTCRVELKVAARGRTLSRVS